jgi:hypothetical protein
LVINTKSNKNRESNYLKFPEKIKSIIENFLSVENELPDLVDVVSYYLSMYKDDEFFRFLEKDLKLYVLIDLDKNRIVFVEKGKDSVDRMNFLQILNPKEFAILICDSIKLKPKRFFSKKKVLDKPCFIENVNTNIKNSVSNLLSEIILGGESLTSGTFRDRITPLILKDEEFLDSFDKEDILKLLSYFSILQEDDRMLYINFYGKGESFYFYDLLDNRQTTNIGSSYLDLVKNKENEIDEIKFRILINKIDKFSVDDLVDLYSSEIISEKNVSNFAKEKGRDPMEILDNIQLSINKKFDEILESKGLLLPESLYLPPLINNQIDHVKSEIRKTNWLTTWLNRKN